MLTMGGAAALEPTGLYMREWCCAQNPVRPDRPAFLRPPTTPSTRAAPAAPSLAPQLEPALGRTLGAGAVGVVVSAPYRRVRHRA